MSTEDYSDLVIERIKKDNEARIQASCAAFSECLETWLQSRTCVGAIHFNDYELLLGIRNVPRAFVIQEIDFLKEEDHYIISLSENELKIIDSKVQKFVEKQCETKPQPVLRNNKTITREIVEGNTELINNLANIYSILLTLSYVDGHIRDKKLYNELLLVKKKLESANNNITRFKSMLDF